MTEDLLREALRERADRTAPLGDVAATARGIRRRRRTTGALIAAAAVVAITIPIAVVANGPDPDPTPVEPGPTGPELTPDGTPPPPILDGEAPPPLIGYAVDGQIINPDGSSLDLPESLTSFTPYRGGYLVTEYSDSIGQLQIFNLDEHGASTDLGCAPAHPALSADATSVTWVQFPCSGEPSGSAEDGVHLASAAGTGESSNLVQAVSATRLAIVGNEIAYAMADVGTYVTDLRSEPRQIPGLLAMSDATDMVGSPATCRRPTRKAGQGR